MNRKVIAVLFGSESDLDHVKKVTGALNERGWKYFPDHSVVAPAFDFRDMVYHVWPGSVHRDYKGTLGYVAAMSTEYKNVGDRLMFLTCIGLRDEASGCVSAATGNRVVALPPDSKAYLPKYPKGVRVYAFSGNSERNGDIADALRWIEHEFDSPSWDKDDAETEKSRSEARQKLDKLRERIEKGEITF
jgi:phosphoribosylcarboxyaminoimidazole (NCAIR) mutase